MESYRQLSKKCLFFISILCSFQVVSQAFYGLLDYIYSIISVTVLAQGIGYSVVQSTMLVLRANGTGHAHGGHALRGMPLALARAPGAPYYFYIYY